MKSQSSSLVTKNTGKINCFRVLMFVWLLTVSAFQTSIAAGAKYHDQHEQDVMSEYEHGVAVDARMPEHRIVAYYGNFLSKRMGVLGEYPPDVMLSMLKKEVRKWEKVDPDTKVVPAIEYIAVVAQKDPGKDGKYRARMPDAGIQKAIALAKEVNGIVILDVQVGHSDVESEITRLEPFLKNPNVMLAIDPEFSMNTGHAPGKKIGSIDGREVNVAIKYLSNLVRKYDLPPKILIVHRFTRNMVTNAKSIKPTDEVQVIMDMDGWGPQSLKKDSYNAYVASEPVQFTGIKIFYKNDLKGNSAGLLTPEQIMQLKPVPMFIMFQ